MRAEWELAIRQLDSVGASPYAVSYFTLPRHWQFMEQIKQSQPSGNLLTDGSFELNPLRTDSGWVLQQTTLDDVVLSALRVKEVAKEPAKLPPNGKAGAATNPSASQTVDDATRTGSGVNELAGDNARTAPRGKELPHGQQCLKLQIKAKDPNRVPAALERTFLAVNSPMVRLQPGSLVRISGWVHIPARIGASVDGALLYDNIGGEPLAIRLTAPTPWRKFTLYRKVPAAGVVQVTLALTGLGNVYFDDIRVEPLTAAGPGSGAPQTTAQ
jgi:hypothetical protein